MSQDNSLSACSCQTANAFPATAQLDRNLAPIQTVKRFGELPVPDSNFVSLEKRGRPPTALTHLRAAARDNDQRVTPCCHGQRRPLWTWLWSIQSTVVVGWVRRLGNAHALGFGVMRVAIDSLAGEGALCAAPQSDIPVRVKDKVRGPDVHVTAGRPTATRPRTMA